MRDLLLEALGWLGYLERSQVLLQLLAFTAAVLGMRRLLRPWIAGARLRRRWRTLLLTLSGPAMALGLSALLPWAGQGFGLLRFLATLWLGWNLLALLEQSNRTRPSLWWMR